MEQNVHESNREKLALGKRALKGEIEEEWNLLNKLAMSGFF